jgi:hypothetical protein
MKFDQLPLYRDTIAGRMSVLKAVKQEGFD